MIPELGHFALWLALGTSLLLGVMPLAGAQTGRPHWMATARPLAYGLGDFGTVFKGARIYVTGQNLFVITKYDGFDPEVNTIKREGNQVPSAGIDYLPYPSARTFTFGLNFSL